MSVQENAQNQFHASVSETAPEILNIEHDKQQGPINVGQNRTILFSSAEASRDGIETGNEKIEIGVSERENTETQERFGIPTAMNDLGIISKTHLESLGALATPEQLAVPSQLGLPPGTLPHELNSPNGATQNYLDPTPKTPRQEVSPSRKPHPDTKAMGDGTTDCEIQSIMEQFGRTQEVEGARDNWAASEFQLSAPLQHPPRRSSLIPIEATKRLAERDDGSTDVDDGKNQITGTETILPDRKSSLPHAVRHGATQDTSSSSIVGPPTQHAGMPPPAPDPESDLPFDFHRFLEQLRDKSADPVAKYLRSFLIEFGRKQWMVHEQVKLINDFLSFITNKMGRCSVWRDVSDAEFDNAKEGMEKLVMNRLYTQTFSPAIPPPAPSSTSKGKRKPVEKNTDPGRRGQHQEDIERDEILGQKIRIYGWVREDHLDIPRIGDNGRRFLLLAQQELIKIKSYRAPRDKIICVLNCCKVIFGILRNSKSSDTSADSFVPLLIYVVLHANPDHLVSNVQYVLRFRNQEKLGGEAGYYLSSLMGAIQFIESLDRTTLTVTDREFEENVEAAVSAIAEKHQDQVPLSASQRLQPPRGLTANRLPEKSGPSMPEVVPRNSIEAEYSSPHKPTSARGRAREGIDGSGDDSTAVGGLLRTIQKPLTSIGRMFSDDPGSGFTAQNSRLLPEQNPRLSPAVFQPPRHLNDANGSTEEPPTQSPNERLPLFTPKSDLTNDRAGHLSAEEAASRQASAEAAEAHRAQQAEHHNIVETLSGMFPDLDRDVIDDVVRQKQGRVGLAVDACLLLNN